MKYGYFDNKNREYVFDRVDTPASWTNYLGVEDMCTVINQTAGGYTFYKSPEYHRVTRFRGNAVPIDRPGHYVYVRDDDTGEFWSLSWQPVGLPLDKAKYTAKHGFSYSKFACDYSGIKGEQTLFIPRGDAVEIWDVNLKNESGKTRNLSIYSYVEFSFHHINIDNLNYQMSLYCSGSDYKDGIIDIELFYEHTHQFFASSEKKPDGYDCLRDKFLGLYNTETNPLGVINGKLTGSKELGNNHCGALQKKITLKDGEDFRLLFFLGEGGVDEGKQIRDKYTFAQTDKAFADLRAFWDEKCSQLTVDTPNEGMNTMLNVWTLYQSEVNVMFSRFASFIEVGGRTGLGYRDTSQDAMTIPHSNYSKCKQRIVELCNGLTSAGYGLHLFQPEWFEEQKKPAFKSPTVVPTPDKDSIVHGIKDACADDALWLVPSICELVKESGDLKFLDEVIPYADNGLGGVERKGSVYEHITKILDFSTEQIGQNGICKGLRADWNDCLNLGGGESAMVSFLHYWALTNFIELAAKLGKKDDVKKYTDIANKVREVSEATLFDKGEGDEPLGWYIRGITSKNRKIGTHADIEGKVHMESNTWAVVSGTASTEHGKQCMDAVDKYLYTEYGLMLNAPCFETIDDDIGFVTRVYKGVKENGAIFSHPNPWAWVAEAKLGRGDRAMKFYDAICPALQNDKIEIRESEPYSYCQFVYGSDHTAFGRARHPFMTGSGGWSYFAATRYILGIRPEYDTLTIDPCIPSSWKGFKATRKWRGATYNITVENPSGVQKGVKEITVNGTVVKEIKSANKGDTIDVKVTLG
ncbi:MAG: N,N'-diacetylchitobiose phosphorylase [Oscillospiraceae bacterium]|jgi:N,N'-diacetylchitobiose phosphorylase|nr:N,N'-diacetylchitobiose phosphorylase [Oscillospiraceae bacterium]